MSVGKLSARRGGRSGNPKEKPPLQSVSFKDAAPHIGGPGVVKNWFERDAMSLVYGPWGCCKTFLVLDCALHVSMGKPWGGSRVTPGLTVYCAVEAGRAIQNRIFAFKRHHRLEGVDLPFEAVLSPLDLCHRVPEPNDAQRLWTLVKEIEERFAMPVILLIVDTVSRALGGGDENSSSDVGSFITSLDLLREHLAGCHILGIHHLGKDASKGARGHSSLSCAVDTAVEVQRAADGVYAASMTKQRDGPKAPPRCFRIKPVQIGIDEDLEPVTSCVIEWADALPLRANPVKTTVANKVALAALRAVIAADGVNDEKRGAVTASLEAWQTEFAARMREQGKSDDAARMAWKREIEKGVPGIAINGEIAWIEQDELPF